MQQYAICSKDLNQGGNHLRECDDDAYDIIVQMLNKKQREFFYHVLHLIKTSEKPFYAFLSGGGGVGKSHLIK